jgi:hypothetical protein
MLRFSRTFQFIVEVMKKISKPYVHKIPIQFPSVLKYCKQTLWDPFSFGMRPCVFTSKHRKPLPAVPNGTCRRPEPPATPLWEHEVSQIYRNLQVICWRENIYWGSYMNVVIPKHHIRVYINIFSYRIAFTLECCHTTGAELLFPECSPSEFNVEWIQLMIFSTEM